MWFEIVSTLRINLEEGELIPIEVASNVEELVFGLWVGGASCHIFGAYFRCLF